MNWKALSYSGFVTIEYERIQQKVDEVLGVLDLNKNGRVDTDDAMAWYDKVLKVST